jgi:hypothetical protein
MQSNAARLEYAPVLCERLFVVAHVLEHFVTENDVEELILEWHAIGRALQPTDDSLARQSLDVLSRLESKIATIGLVAELSIGGNQAPVPASQIKNGRARRRSEPGIGKNGKLGMRTTCAPLRLTCAFVDRDTGHWLSPARFPALLDRVGGTAGCPRNLATEGRSAVRELA